VDGLVGYHNFEGFNIKQVTPYPILVFYYTNTWASAPGAAAAVTPLDFHTWYIIGPYYKWFRWFIFLRTTKYQIKFLTHNITKTKTLNKVNIAVTESCEAPLGHQVEQPPIKFKLNCFLLGTMIS